jgi:hypothetical protein
MYLQTLKVRVYECLLCSSNPSISRCSERTYILYMIDIYIYSFGFYQGNHGIGSICTPDHIIDIAVWKESARLVAASILKDEEGRHQREKFQQISVMFNRTARNFPPERPWFIKSYPVNIRYREFRTRRRQEKKCTGFIYELFHRILDYSHMPRTDVSWMMIMKQDRMVYLHEV